MKKTLSLLLCITLLCSFLSCGKTDDGPRSPIGGIHGENGDVYPTAFLSFDGKEVEFDEFRYYYLNYKNMYLSEDADHFKKEGNEEALKEEILQVLQDSWAVRLLAEEKKVRLSKSDLEKVESDIEKTVEFYNGEDAFLASLEESFMSEELYRYMMEYSALYLKLFNELYGEDGDEAWTDEEFYEYYRAHYLAVQQIFIPYEEGENASSHPDTLKIADEIHAKAENGEDFWQLIEKHGKDDNMLDYPDGYYFTKGQAEDVLYEASLALEIGKISKPIAAEKGLYVIKRLELKPLRMDENRETTLFGYTDTLNEWHAGVYDEEFQKLYGKRADEIRVEYGEHWKAVSTASVY